MEVCFPAHYQNRKMSFSVIETIILALLFAVSVWPGELSPIAENLNGPVFHVSQRNIELGSLVPNEKRPFSFQIGNKGNDTLIIHSISTNCGCLGPAKKWKDAKLQPGEIRQVEFSLLAGSQGRGRMAKTIMFKTSDTNREYSPVVIRYTVKPNFRVVALPAKLDFGRVKPENSAAVLSVILVSPYPEPIKVNSIKCTNPSMVISREGSNALGDAVLYTVEFPGHLQAGPLSESVTIDTTVGKVVVPIIGYKIGKIECKPSHIIFPPVNRYEGIGVCLTVTSPIGKKFRILWATAETDQIQVSVERSQEPSAAHKLWLQLTPNKGVRGVGQSWIFIATDKFGSRLVSCTYLVH